MIASNKLLLKQKQVQFIQSMNSHMTASRSLPGTQGPILIKASLKRHSPEQIYDYIANHIGDLGMKIKKRQAIIGFQDRSFYQKLINEHKSIMLHGKKLQFELLQKSDQNYIVSQQQQALQLPKPGEISTPQFRARDNVQSRVHSCRVAMIEKVNQLFQPTIEETRRKVSQLKLQFKENGPRQRQIFSLQTAIDKKLKGIQTKYQVQIDKVQKFIRDFSVKPTSIDLQPTFKFEQTWQFPQIPINRMKFEPDSYFTNNGFYPCKRLCAINGSQFAVSMYNPKYLKGSIKLYDVSLINSKSDIQVPEGAYGLCRINKFLLIGSYDSTIKYVNLDDSERQVQSSKKLTDALNISFYDIRVLKPSVQKPQILTLSIDNVLRKFEVSYQQIVDGVFDLSFDVKQEIKLDDCITIQPLSPEVILLGGIKKLRKYHMEKKMFKEIAVNDKPVKIKKFNDNLIAVASSKVVELADLRTESVVQTFSHMPRQMRSLQVIGQHSLMYGAAAEIGLLDDRKHELFPWKSEAHHKGIVYDILKLKNRVVSCDSSGIIHSWKLAQDSFFISQQPSVEIQFINKHH